MSMKSLNDAGEQRDSSRPGKVAAEQLARAIATRYGFRPHDFSIVWDGGDFDTSRPQHEMMVKSNDGRHAAARIDNEALLQEDAWKYLRDVDAAFATLGRRTLARGI